MRQHFSRLSGGFYRSRLRLPQTQKLLTRDPLGDELEVAVGDERDPLDLPLVAEAFGEQGQLPRILQRRAARVDHACEQELFEAFRDVREMRPVEVDPDR